MDSRPTREEGLSRLRSFLERAPDYARTRNYDRGPADRDNVSVLSPYLRHRLVTEEEVWEAVLGRHPFGRVEKFLQEVVWRTYWKGWLEQRPSVWDEWLSSLEAGRAERPAALAERVGAARAGETGIAPFDEWARELAATNYLHNHARMWFASIWIFTLRLPWEEGAAFFLEHLLDGDPASNTLGWRWVGGLQTRGKHYLARAANIREFTGGRLDPGDALREEAEPLPWEELPAPRPPDPPPSPGSDPPREGDGLFLTTDDLAPETLFAGEAFEAVAGGRPEESDPRNPAEASPVAAFRREAVRSTLERQRDRRGRRGTWLGPAAPESVLDWAREAGIRRLWIPHAPVGPTRRALEGIAAKAGEAGPCLRPFARDWDRRLHPHAKAGFFRFKKEVLPLLRTPGRPG
jgi:deoxyribodipyrimidine photo-lyase